jgi:selenocysteine-specific elongation factor
LPEKTKIPIAREIIVKLRISFMDLIVGTAGHIDHGKTALVKALTGVDADRLPEEKERGITIDIGFAELHLGDVNIGFVDVPGHEKFVKNMLAGAHGIDVVMLVVAADEGVMPQTREHFEICRLLGVGSGIIVLTKNDLVDQELIELAELDVSELVEGSFLQNAPIVSVSAKTGDGIDELKTALSKIGSDIPERKSETIARLPIDRSFSVKGFGAVVTGTLVSGEISEGEEFDLLPTNTKVRVRGIQAHGKSVEIARAGQRTAINLGGIDHLDIERGMLLAEKGVLRSSQILDAEIELLKSAKKALKTRQRVRVHIGTIEVLARIQILNEAREIKQGETDFAQIRLETPVASIPNERIILRSYSPQITIAGGKILDSHATKHRRKELQRVREILTDLRSFGDKMKIVRRFLEMYGQKGASFTDLQARTGWRKDILDSALLLSLGKTEIIKADEFYIARIPFDNLTAKALDEITAFHNSEPLAKGVPRETLREKLFANVPLEIFKGVLGKLEAEGEIIATDFVRLSSHSLELSENETKLREKLKRIYESAKLEVPKLEEVLVSTSNELKSNLSQTRKIFQLLLNSGEIVKISEEFYFSKSEIDLLVLNLTEFAAAISDRMIDVAKFKEIAGISRKYAIPLLEYFDRERVTRRAGDKRLIL